MTDPKKKARAMAQLEASRSPKNSEWMSPRAVGGLAVFVAAAFPFASLLAARIQGEMGSGLNLTSRLVASLRDGVGFWPAVILSGTVMAMAAWQFLGEKALNWLHLAAALALGTGALSLFASALAPGAGGALGGLLVPATGSGLGRWVAGLLGVICAGAALYEAFPALGFDIPEQPRTKFRVKNADNKKAESSRGSRAGTGVLDGDPTVDAASETGDIRPIAAAAPAAPLSDHDAPEEVHPAPALPGARAAADAEGDELASRTHLAAGGVLGAVAADAGADAGAAGLADEQESAAPDLDQVRPMGSLSAAEGVGAAEAEASESDADSAGASAEDLEWGDVAPFGGASGEAQEEAADAAEDLEGEAESEDADAELEEVEAALEGEEEAEYEEEEEVDEDPDAEYEDEEDAEGEEGEEEAEYEDGEEAEYEDDEEAEYEDEEEAEYEDGEEAEEEEGEAAEYEDEEEAEYEDGEEPEEEEGEAAEYEDEDETEYEDGEEAEYEESEAEEEEEPELEDAETADAEEEVAEAETSAEDVAAELEGEDAVELEVDAAPEADAEEAEVLAALEVEVAEVAKALEAEAGLEVESEPQSTGAEPTGAEPGGAQPEGPEAEDEAWQEVELEVAEADAAPDAEVVNAAAAEDETSGSEALSLGDTLAESLVEAAEGELGEPSAAASKGAEVEAASIEEPAAEVREAQEPEVPVAEAAEGSSTEGSAKKNKQKGRGKGSKGGGKAPAPVQAEDEGQPGLFDEAESTGEPEVVLEPQAGAPAEAEAPAAVVAAADAGGALDPATDWERLVYESGCLFLDEGRVAVSMLQKRYSMDFKQSTAVLDELQERGLIGPYLGGKRRDILLSREEWQAQALNRS